MSNKLYFACFAFGVGIGVYCVRDYYRSKFSKLADEEIETMREVFSKEQKENSDQKKTDNVVRVSMPAEEFEKFQKEIDLKNKTKPLTPDALEKIAELAPGDDIPEMKKAKEIIDKYVKTPKDVEPGPYVISPDDYGGTFEYECVSLVHYSDGVFVDDDQNVVKDVEELIGDDALDYVGEYEPDAVYVRNDAKECDYQVLIDERKWSDVKRKQAH